MQSNISVEMAQLLNQFIAENAHRHIFTEYPIEEIDRIVPRVVDSDAYIRE